MPHVVPCNQCALRRLDVFRSNTPEELDFIQQFKQDHVTLEADKAVVREGERSELYTLYSGLAFRYKTMRDGRRQILNFLFPGDLIGLQDQLGDNAQHGVETLTTVQLCRFKRDELWSLFRSHPALGYDVTWLAAHEESVVDDNLLTVGRRTAHERIAVLMMSFYKRAASVGMENEGRVPFPVTQQLIADAIGMSLIHTNRSMRQLRALGLYEIKQGWLSLPKPNTLARLTEYFASPVKARPLI